MVERVKRLLLALVAITTIAAPLFVSTPALADTIGEVFIDNGNVTAGSGGLLNTITLQQPSPGSFFGVGVQKAAPACKIQVRFTVTNAATGDGTAQIDYIQNGTACTNGAHIQGATKLIKPSAIPAGCPGTTVQGPIATTAPPVACPGGGAVVNGVFNINGTVAPPAGAAPAAPPCDAGPFTWAACPLLSLVQGAISTMEGVIANVLTVNALPQTGPLKTVWASFRDLADVGFILVFFAVIFGTSLGIENYAIKKVLPRLVAGAILVQFSYLLASLVVDVTNVLGVGLYQLINSAVQVPATAGAATTNGVIGVGIFTGLLVGLGAGALVIATGLIVPVLLTVVSALFAMLAVYLTLQLRLLIINLLVVVAPIAFLLWVLPNTEKYFKMWYETFSKLLLMYPIIMLMFAAAGLTSAIGNSVTTQGDAASQVLQKLIAAILPILVFFFIPKTFSYAGRLLVGGSNLISKGTGGAGKGLRNKVWSKEKQEERKNNGLLRYNSALNSAPTTLRGKSLRALQMNTGRRQAGIGSGSFIPFRTSAASNRRLNDAGDKALDQHAAAEGLAFANMNLSNKDDRDTLVKAAKDGKNKAKQIAAIEKLSTGGAGQEELRAMRDSFTGPTGDGNSQQVWKKGTAKVDKSSAPDLIGGSSVFDGANAEGMSKWNKQTMQAAVSHWNNMASVPAATRGADANNKLATAQRNLHALSTNQKLKASINRDTAAVLHGWDIKDANGRVVGTQTATFLNDHLTSSLAGVTDSAGNLTTARRSIDNNFNTDGTYIP